MTAEVLREAVKLSIQERLNLLESEIRLMDGPRPTLATGKIFIAVHPGDIDTAPLNYGLDEFYSVNVTVSLKGANFQLNRWLGTSVGGAVLLGSAFEYLRNQILHIHQNYNITKRANEQLSAESPFIEPLNFIRATTPEERYGAWWGDSDAGNKKPAGMSQTIAFARARRIRDNSEIH